MAHLNDEHLELETIEMMWASQTTSNWEETGYGIGWSNSTDESGNRVARHSGGLVGGITELRFHPEHELVIAIIINTDTASIQELAQNIASRPCSLNLTKLIRLGTVQCGGYYE